MESNTWGMIHVCVADLICGHQPALLNASGLKASRNEHRLRSQKHRLADAIDQLASSASSNCCATCGA